MTRRRTDTRPSHSRLTRITKIHESGHAVGRYITNSQMGCEIGDSVHCIEMHDPKTAAPFMGSDGRQYIKRATTLGPMFSTEIEAASKPVDERYGLKEGKPIPQAYYTDVIAVARAAGANIDEWAMAKVLQAIAGPAAEGKATGRTFDAMLSDAACAHDFQDAIRSAGSLDGRTSKSRAAFNGVRK